VVELQYKTVAETKTAPSDRISALVTHCIVPKFEHTSHKCKKKTKFI